MYSLQFTDGTLFKRQFFYCRSKARIQFTSWAKAFKVPVSRDRVSPGDSISIQNLPPEDLFRNRFAPRRLYSKTKSPGGRDYFIPRRNKLSPGESLFRCELGYSHIAFIAKKSTLFWFTHLYPNYALFSSRN